MQGQGQSSGSLEDPDAQAERRPQRGPQPFELEMIESALMVATGSLDSDLVKVSRQLQSVLAKLPLFINPKNLEELRKVKSLLVELESRADTLRRERRTAVLSWAAARCYRGLLPGPTGADTWLTPFLPAPRSLPPSRELLEELLEDEEELREFNLSSRPKREEKQRQRERERLERELGKGPDLPCMAASPADDATALTCRVLPAEREKIALEEDGAEDTSASHLGGPGGGNGSGKRLQKR